MKKAIKKYLQTYAEQAFVIDIERLLSERRYGHSLVIPVHAEGTEVITTLDTIPKTGLPHLIILVLNARKNDEPHIHQLNDDSHRAIKAAYPIAQPQSDSIFAYQHPAGTLLLVDCYSKEKRFGNKEGVGLARKIGTDMALAVWDKGYVSSPYIHSSDADVSFPDDYFQQVLDASPRESHSAILLPFWHEPNPETKQLRRANALYEIKLRYYVLGLRFAQSPYAFHSIGSTLAIHAADYAKVRGFPKRQAGEDFYLLNKLNKTRPIKRSRGQAIKIQGRHSQRVPFGTGKGIMELEQKPDDECLFYSPESFSQLRLLQQTLKESFENPKCHSEDVIGRFERPLRESLRNLKLDEGIVASIKRGSTREQRQKNFHTYFDGFRTLKLIHALRADFFPSIPFRQALSKAAFIPSEVKKINELDELRYALNDLEFGIR